MLCVFLCSASCVSFSRRSSIAPIGALQSTRSPPATDHRCRKRMPRLHLLPPAVRAKRRRSCGSDMCCSDIQRHARAACLFGAGCPYSRRSWQDPCFLCGTHSFSWCHLHSPCRKKARNLFLPYDQNRLGASVSTRSTTAKLVRT